MIEPSSKKKTREFDKRIIWYLGNAIVTFVAMVCLVFLPLYEKTSGEQTSYLSAFGYATSLEGAQMWVFIVFIILLIALLITSSSLLSINAFNKKRDLEKKDKFFTIATILNIIAFAGYGLFAFALNLLISMAICILLALLYFIGLWIHFKHFSCLAD